MYGKLSVTRGAKRLVFSVAEFGPTSMTIKQPKDTLISS